VLRIGGKRAAAITLAGDSLKGLVPLLLAQWFNASPHLLALVLMQNIVSLLLFWRHRSDIRQLLAGTEGKIQAEAEPSQQGADEG
jgi:glycerol-3-phosphate acyltransferase PlsY